MMDVYSKTMKLNKDHVYVYELKGHTKHLNIFINRADVFIIMSTPPSMSGACLTTDGSLERKWKHVNASLTEVENKL